MLTYVAIQIPVYEFQFGGDLKEHVMRRRHDNWINATHILKAAGFDKPARTRILERDVQKDVHEKIQGGYGKYQGSSSLYMCYYSSNTFTQAPGYLSKADKH